jgi:dihydropteroate synthase
LVVLILNICDFLPLLFKIILSMISKDNFFSKKQALNFNGTLFDLSSPVVMGILNITPDSFYDGGRYTTETEILKRCELILSQGASIIDIGAYSSRPGAEDITEEDELNRLRFALNPIRKEFQNAFISVDTFRSEIAQRVVDEFGVQMINDISAGQMDIAMLEIVANLKVPYIMMHMQGTPQNMQHQTSYAHLIRDIMHYFAEKIAEAKQLDMHDIIIDPGFGFSKTLEQNYQLLSKLNEFKIFELPIMVGISRKSMIYKILESKPEQALAGTITANTLALLNGANILRVHDVKEAVDAVKIVKAYKNFYL